MSAAAISKQHSWGDAAWEAQLAKLAAYMQNIPKQKIPSSAGSAARRRPGRATGAKGATGPAEPEKFAVQQIQRRRLTPGGASEYYTL
jgi:hypothetical protein